MKNKKLLSHISGSWMSLDSLFYTRNGYTPSKKEAAYWQNGTLPWFRLEDIRLNGRILGDSIQHVTSEALKGSGLFPANSIIIATSATIGEHALVTVESIANQRFTYLIPKSGTLHVLDIKYFFYYCYLLDKWCLQNTNAGAAFPSVNMDLFKKCEIFVPSDIEIQKKIAASLSAIDELINAEEATLLNYEQHRKGLLQKLFPQSGHKVPEYRFPEFVNSSAWREVALYDTRDKDIKWSFTGGPFGSNMKSSDYTSSGVRVIQLNNIGDGEFSDSSKIYVSRNKADELLSCNIYPGEIIMSKLGNPVGRACIIPNTEARYVMCSDGIRLVVDEVHFDKYFIYSMINSSKFRAVLDESSTGSTRRRIGLETLKKLKFLAPIDKEEQDLIGNTLSSIDRLISEQKVKVDKFKAHKKGLIQELFFDLNNK